MEADFADPARVLVELEVVHVLDYAGHVGGFGVLDELFHLQERPQSIYTCIVSIKMFTGPIQYSTQCMYQSTCFTMSICSSRGRSCATGRICHTCMEI